MFNKKYLFKILEQKGSLDFRTIAKIMKVKIKENREFSSFLYDLVKRKEIFTDNERRYYIPKFIGNFIGTIKISPKGFGFVDMEDNNNIFILSSNMNTSFNGDKVEVRYFEDKIKPGSLQGFVLKVIERKRKYFVGRVIKIGNFFTIKPFDKKIIGNFRFENSKGLEVNQEIKVEITKFSTSFHTIKLIKKLGMSNDASIDVITVIEDAGIPTYFLEETIKDARKIPLTIDNENKENRIDLRDQLIYTIDGDDTKDFDDAISVKKLKNGNFMLGVHIADVTHYVKENEAIDKEAKMRGTSIYLVDRVIPMLPESLSNGICSLNPNVDRFVISCEMEIDSKGNTISSKIFPGIINSKYRLTYKEVNNFYQNKDDIWNNKELTDSLNLALDLSKIIRKYKNEEGYIDFEIQESKIILDKDGNTKDIVLRERLFSEILIEDFMVRANETVAKYIEKMKLTFIYRTHDKPDFEKVSSLQNVIKLLGMDIKIPTSPIPKEFAKAINKIKETRFDDFIKIMMLRTMSKAEYSPSNIGHFGLASKSYTHFTSPIRRYPDLMVHRMLREYLFNDNKERSKHFASIMTDIASHSSLTEIKSVELERKVADIKKAEFYQQFIGKELEGTIVSIMSFGFFVEFPNKAGGLVHSSTLYDGKYILENNGFSLTNKKREFTIGDKINVIVIAANKDEAKVDLIIPEMYEIYKNKK